MSHAPSDGRSPLTRAQQTVRGRAALMLPEEALLDLALIYAAEHEQMAALRICDTVLDLRHSDRAVVLKAWCTLYTTPGSDWLEPQVGPLEKVARDDNSMESGAAAMILAQVYRELGRSSPTLLIGLLERSVERNPDWVTNRFVLAVERTRAGDEQGALAEFERAIGNLLATEPGDPVAAAYDSCYAGRVDSEENLRGLFAELTRVRRPRP